MILPADDLLYLAYGSNLLPARLGARTPSARSLGTVELPGFRLGFHKRGSDGSAKCDLVVDGGARAYGALYALDPLEKPVLDLIEGVGSGYEELRIELDGYGSVFLYVAQSTYIDPSLSPFEWYHRFVLEGARYHRLPPDYLEEIASVRAIPDPDPARAAENARILERAQGGSSR